MNINFEKQDQCKIFKGSVPPKFKSAFNKGSAPWTPWSHLEIATEDTTFQLWQQQSIENLFAVVRKFPVNFSLSYIFVS